MYDGYTSLGIGRNSAVGSSVHVVDVLEVIGAWPKVCKVTDGLVVHGIVRGFSCLEGLDICLAGYDLHAGQTILQIGVLDDLFGRAIDADGKDGSSCARAERIQQDALALDLLRRDVAEQRHKATVKGGGVHVAASSHCVHARLQLGLLLRLAERGKGLLHIFVCNGRLSVELGKFSGDGGVILVFRVGDEVVVQQTAKAFLNELRVRAVQEGVVKVVDLNRGECRGVRVAVDRSIARTSRQLGRSQSVGIVSLVQAAQVGLDGLWAVDLWVLGGEIGLVEVPVVAHVRSMSRLQDKGSVRANQHGDRTSSSDRASGTFGVDGNVASDNDRISAIPRAALNPVDSVEEGGSTTVAGVLAVDTFNVVVTRLREQVHQNRLHRLGFVDDGFGSNV